MDNQEYKKVNDLLGLPIKKELQDVVNNVRYLIGLIEKKTNKLKEVNCDIMELEIQYINSGIDKIHSTCLDYQNYTTNELISICEDTYLGIIRGLNKRKYKDIEDFSNEVYESVVSGNLMALVSPETKCHVVCENQDFGEVHIKLDKRLRSYSKVLDKNLIYVSNKYVLTRINDEISNLLVFSHYAVHEYVYNGLAVILSMTINKDYEIKTLTCAVYDPLG